MSGTPPIGIVEECLANGVRLVLVNKLVPQSGVDVIMCDDFAGADLELDVGERLHLAAVGGTVGLAQVFDADHGSFPDWKKA